MPELYELPFTKGRAALLDALRTRGAAVVQAPPGTGKTTLAPQYVLDHVRNRTGEPTGKVVVTQPRRVAARSAAARISALRGTRLGDETGYTVRGDRKVSAGTAIEMVTPGVLLRRLLADPDLTGVSAVVVDEVHERHLESDLVFGMLAQLRGLRSGPGEELCVVAMSATLDAARFATLLGDEVGPAPLVDVPSPIHPLEIHYSSAESSMVNRDRRTGSAVEDRILATVHRAFAETGGSDGVTGGDLLAFVPTIRATDAVASALRHDNVDAVALHGRLDTAEQARIVGGHTDGHRRVIIATDVAESSLTVPGVRVVVDSCLSRISRRDTTRGMSVLVTETASRASMTQRAGRAGREGPGTVYRCLTSEQYTKAPAASPPAILTSDLTSATLDVACWGSPRGADLPLPDPFPTSATDAAETALREIGALDAAGRVTGDGRRLAGIPTDPRLARGGLTAVARVDPTTVAKVLAVLDGGVGSPTDLPGELPRSADPVVRRFRGILENAGPVCDRSADLHGNDSVAYTVACSRPGWIARRVTGHRFLTLSGTGAVWHDPAGYGGDWIAVADIAGAAGAGGLARTEGTGAVIRAAVPLEEELAFDAAAPLLSDTVICTWTPGGAAGRLSARRVRTLGAVELSSTPVSVAGLPAGIREEAVRQGLADHGFDALPWSAKADGLRRRIHYLHDRGVTGYPDVADATRGDRLAEFVVPELASGHRPDLAGLLRGLIPWNRRLDEDAPAAFTLPSGRSVALHYPEVGSGGPVVASTRLQDCFGLRESPVIAGRRVQFHLLSPAQRPLAVTDDLASFWDGPYAQVRSEMRGRYPKHRWPEHPEVTRS